MATGWAAQCGLTVSPSWVSAPSAGRWRGRLDAAVFHRSSVFHRNGERRFRRFAAGALTDIADTPERAVQDADLVVLAAPPDAILQLLQSLPPSLPSGALLTDVASVKLPLIARAQNRAWRRATQGVIPSPAPTSRVGALLT